jgi:PPIC-type PPIASE domain
VAKVVGTLTACSVLILALVGLNACGEASDVVVARVGDNAITRGTFDRWMSVQAARDTSTIATPKAFQMLARDPPDYSACAAYLRAEGARPGESQLRPTVALRECRWLYETLKRRVLDFLISSERTIGQAAELGITISEKETRDQLARFNYERIYGPPDRSPMEIELQTLLSSKGESASDRLWITKVHVLFARVRSKLVSEAERQIPASEVVRYYRSHKRLFVVPERRNVEAIMTFTRARAQKAKHEIEAGNQFLRVAERANEQPSEGGLHIGLSRSTVGKKRYEHDFFAAKPYVLIGPLKERMYYIFEVTKIISAGQHTLAQADSMIRRRLIASQQRRRFTNIVAAFETEWRDRIHCRAGYMSPPCGQSYRPK